MWKVVVRKKNSFNLKMSAFFRGVGSQICQICRGIVVKKLPTEGVLGRGQKSWKFADVLNGWSHMRTSRWFSAIYPIKLSYTHVWKSDLDQLRSWSKSFFQTCVHRFFREVAFRLWKKKWPIWLLQLSLLTFFTLNFFRFNMFIWRSIMSYVNAVLIKISVLNSTMTTASTSKFIFHFILFIYDHSQTFLSIRCSQMRTLQNQVVSKSPIVL